MPRRSAVPARPTTPEEVVEKITDVSVVEEMRSSYLEYSVSVIVARALPDVRDGLKSVHRRILYSMSQNNLRPNGPYRKCAKVAGDVMGTYHPHGDSAIYDTMVRMAQDWSMGLPLIDGHGNFGSRDAGAAASRYTECRLSYAGLAMTRDLGEDTVDLIPTYDNATLEPLVLPAAFPNLLVNGSQGIAVGMATSMAPHNLAECLGAARAFIANEHVTLDELMKYVPAPDFPTGGVIVGTDGIREAYATGRGKVRLRAKYEIVDSGPRRRAIVVTELPYGVGPELDVLDRIKSLVNSKRLQGIADVKDLSDRHQGLNITIQVKTGFDPRAVLEELYRLTGLEATFSINNVALVGQRPETLSLVDLLRHYVNHRRDVVRRRSEHRRRVAEARLHIVDGLIIALGSIDEVVAILRSSKDADAARTKLLKAFTLSDVQVAHILDMPLRRLTSLEVTKLRTEKKELNATVKELTDILTKKGGIDKVVLAEFDEIEKEFAVPRRTAILHEVPTYDVTSLEIADNPCVVTVSVGGILSVHDVTDGHVAPLKGKRGAVDVLLSVVTTTRHSPLLAITSRGRALPLSITDLPAATSSARGIPVATLLSLDKDESVLALTSPRDSLVLATRQGVLKRVASAQLPKRTAPVLALKNDDVLVAAIPLADDDIDRTDLVLVSSDAQLLRTPLAPVRPQGAAAAGVAGMNLSEGAVVLAAGVLPVDESADPVIVLTQVTETGSVKVTPALEYPAKGRGGRGVRCVTMKRGEATLQLAYVGPLAGSLALRGTNVVELPTTFTKRDGSGVVLDGGAFTAVGRTLR